jgi:hypothetical protein
MKNITCICLLMTIMFSCEKNGNIETYNNMKVTVPFVINNSVVIPVQQCAGETGTSKYLCVESIFSDSRCPAGAYCIWAGDAAVKFSFSGCSAGDIEFTLHTTLLPRDTTVCGYKFTLKNLLPYPDLERLFNPSEYRAEVLIEDAK